jgi:hypothetical protein
MMGWPQRQRTCRDAKFFNGETECGIQGASGDNKEGKLHDFTGNIEDLLEGTSD